MRRSTLLIAVAGLGVAVAAFTLGGSAGEHNEHARPPVRASLYVSADGSVAGWFTGSPTPGAHGPAVIAAHVDWNHAPAVFFRLRDLEPGDERRFVCIEAAVVQTPVTLAAGRVWTGTQTLTAR